MRQSPRKPARHLLGLAAAVTAAGLALGPWLPALARPVTATATVPGAPTAAAPARQLVLINGDRLTVSSVAGRPVIAVRAASSRDSVTGIRVGGEVLEIPTIALPYLGRGLSPSLFQVSALEKAESGGRLPVRVSFAGTRPAIPGVTITSVSGGVESGYLTAASARTFGAALLRQFTADHASGRFGSHGLFGHGVGIALPGATAPAPTRPAFKMHKLTVVGRNLQGKPDTGDELLIFSADKLGRFDTASENFGFFYHGTSKFSVPSGHFWALAAFAKFTRTGGSLRLVVVPQFSVGSRNATLHIAARSASSKLTFATPRRAHALLENFEVVRGERTGGPIAVTASIFSGMSGWVSPTTRKPTVGTLTTYTSATLVSPRHVSPSYAYNLDFRASGTVPRQNFRVRPADLGAVSERYYQDVPTRKAGAFVIGGTVEQLDFELAPIMQFSMPSRQVQYFSAGRRLLWTLQTVTNLNTFAVGDTDDLRSFRGGQQSAQDFNRYPLHPAPDTVVASAPGLFPTFTSAARHGNTLFLSSTPFSDNQFGHLGPGFFDNGNAKVSSSYSVSENGKTIAHGNAEFGIRAIRLGSAPSAVTFTLSATRRGGGHRLSGASTTTWAWRSARNTSARVPGAWFCAITETRSGFGFVRQCAVQPMMTLNYLVQGMSMTGQTKAGPQAVEVTAGHIQLSHASRITGATAQVSFNDGDSFFPAKVTPEGGGRFRVSYTAPAGVDVTLRLHATDAAGGSITETIVRGYGVSP